MQTILSRVRTYTFFQRSLEQEQEIINRVYHGICGNGENSNNMSVKDFLQTYLSVPPSVIENAADTIFRSLLDGKNVQLESLAKDCDSFKGDAILETFFCRIMSDIVSFSTLNSRNCAAAVQLSEVLRNCRNSINIYNQNVISGIEEFMRNFSDTLRKFQ